MIIDINKPVIDQLPGLPARSAKPKPVDNIIQPSFEELKQNLTGNTFSTGCFRKIITKLLFIKAVNPFLKNGKTEYKEDKFFYRNREFKPPTGDLGKNLMLWSSSLDPEYPKISAFGMKASLGSISTYYVDGEPGKGFARCVGSSLWEPSEFDL